ncbi:MAG: lactonase family protein [Lachnospiraceae bacterium]|nr:lactonase family protein [Lachnospiraceae bacterium]
MEEKYVAYVGTYTHENSVGIHLYDVDIKAGRMEERTVVPINNPSDLIVSKNGKFLYSIADEGVESFRILPDGNLEPVNKQWIGGMRGCYLEVDHENRYLFVAGHHDGKVTMMQLCEDGSIGDIADGIFHKGIGRTIAERISNPHVDCVKLTPDEQYLCAVDNGLDHVKVYQVDYEKGKLKLESIIRGPLESAPRMIRFSRDGRYAYILYELLNQVEVFSYELADGEPKFEKILTISTTTAKEEELCAASGMEISLDGKYLFCTNAGVNSVTIFEIDPETGCLTMMCNSKISGDYPKTLGIYPNGEHFMSLNHETNEITTFRVFYEKKHILMESKPLSIDKPNCVYIHKLNQ